MISARRSVFWEGVLILGCAVPLVSDQPLTILCYTWPMASSLVSRATSLLASSRAAKGTLSRSSATRNVSHSSRRSGRSLISAFHSSSSSQITARLVSSSLSVRHYSGREAHNSQGTQTSAPVRENEAENPRRAHFPSRSAHVRTHLPPERSISDGNASHA